MAAAHVFGCGKAFGLSLLVSVDPDDSGINTKMVKYRGANDMTAYLGRPAELKRLNRDKDE